MTDLDVVIEFWKDVDSIHAIDRNPRLSKRIQETIKYLEELKELRGK